MTGRASISANRGANAGKTYEPISHIPIVSLRDVLIGGVPNFYGVIMPLKHAEEPKDWQPEFLGMETVKPKAEPPAKEPATQPLKSPKDQAS